MPDNQVDRLIYDRIDEPEDARLVAGELVNLMESVLIFAGLRIGGLDSVEVTYQSGATGRRGRRRPLAGTPDDARRPRLRVGPARS